MHTPLKSVTFDAENSATFWFEDGCCMATSLDSEISISLLHEPRFDEKILEGLERCDSFDEEMGKRLK